MAVIDMYVLYQLIKRIGTPFEETKAFKLGLVDKDGRRLKKARTAEEKKAMTYLDRFVFNIKRLLAKVGIKGKMASYAASAYLMKEANEDTPIPSDEEIIEGINKEIKNLQENTYKSFYDLYNEMMTTGAAVAGTGDDPVHWVDKKKMGRKKRNGRAIDAVAYLRRMRRNSKL